MSMTPTGSPEETSAAQWPLVTDATTPPVGVFLRHMTEHLQSCILRKGPQQSLPNRGRRMRDGSRRALGPDHIKYLGGCIEVESGDQCSEITIGESVHGTGR